MSRKDTGHAPVRFVLERVDASDERLRVLLVLPPADRVAIRLQGLLGVIRMSEEGH